MAKYQGRRMVKEDEYAYLQELIESHDDPSAEWGGASYTAGNGIDITSDEISIDNTVVATKTDLEDYELKSDAFSGSYNDLTDKPTIPAAQVQSDWSQADNTAVDYIKNKPTIPDAVSGTNDGTNWTNLTIGSDTYAIPAGGGSVDIDNKTIIENQQGKLETAIGGWKETITSYTFTVPKFGAYAWWQLTDATVANFLYNLLQPNTRYDITLKFYNGDTEVNPTYSITEAYIYSTNKTATRFGDEDWTNNAINIKCGNNESYIWKFFVRIDTNVIEVRDYWPVPGIDHDTITSVVITINGINQTSYHTIDSNYIPDVTNKITVGDGIKIESDTLVSDITGINPIRKTYIAGQSGVKIQLRYDTETLYNNVNNYLTTSIGGGYNNFIAIDKTNVSSTSDYTDVGYIEQNDIVNAIANEIIYYIKQDSLPTPGNWRNRTIQDEVAIQISGLRGVKSIYIKYSVDTNDNNIITVTQQNTWNTIFIDNFTFRLDTGEILTIPNKIYISSSDATNILNGTSGSILLRVEHPEKAGNVKQVDKKFIPLISDIPAVPTTQGTYTLQVVVDQDGNPTFSWVSNI